jgi:hypothetical protein
LIFCYLLFAQADFASPSSSFQIVAPGEKLNVRGTANQIDAVVSATDTLTMSLTNNVTVSNNLTASV